MLREFFIYSWKLDIVGTFVTGLKVVARKFEVLESVDFGNKLNEKFLMAKRMFTKGFRQFYDIDHSYPSHSYIE